MAEDIKALIDKIQKEGVEAGQDKARLIEEDARLAAAKTLADAEKKAAEMVEKARQETQRMQESTTAALKQAGRDMLITLKKEINDILSRLALSSVRESLSPDAMASIIGGIVNAGVQGQAVVGVSKDDAEKLQKALLTSVREELRKGVRIQPSGGVAAGFTISFDAGKSYFDFSDKALAEYIGQYLKPKVAELLK